MTSILNTSETDQFKISLSAEPVKSPTTLSSDLEMLRGITQNAYQVRRLPNLRMPLLILLLIAALCWVGLVLHNHMPALVSLGQELTQKVYQLTSASPTPSAVRPAPARADLRVRPARRHFIPGRVSVLESQQAYDPASHPFYATAVIGERRISLMPNDRIVVLDVAAGTWNFASKVE